MSEYNAQYSIGDDLLQIYNYEFTNPDRRNKAFDHLKLTLDSIGFDKTWLKDPVTIYKVFPKNTPYLILHQAAKLGQLDIIKAFVSRGYPFNTPNRELKPLSRETPWEERTRKTFEFGMNGTPLLIAFAYDNLEIAEYLIDAGARLDVVDSNSLTPLHYAALRGRADLIQKIHGKQGDLINKRDNFGRTPLHIPYYRITKPSVLAPYIIADEKRPVTYRPLLDCIALLKELGAKNNIKDNDGITALNLEAEYDGQQLKAARRAAGDGASPEKSNSGGTWMGTSRNINGRSVRNYNIAKANLMPTPKPSAPPGDPQNYLRSLQVGATPTPSAPPAEDPRPLSKGGRRKRRATQKRRR
jgi:ankyrin repeat protein